jgi:hypothetical protein
MLAVQLVVLTLLGLLHAGLTWAPSGTHSEMLVKLFDVDREMNVPTWFSSMQWFLLASILVAVASATGGAGRGRVRAAVWGAAALVACYFSLDEVAVLHERVGTLFEELVREGGAANAPLRALLGFRSYYWPLVYAPVFLPAALGLVVVVWRDLGKARRTALLGLFVFLYAAVGLDLIEGRYGTPDHSGLPIWLFSRRVSFDIFLLEELLEMLGVALVSYAFLRHLSRISSPGRRLGD